MEDLSRRDGHGSSAPRPIVALLATLGTEPFLSNAIKGILRTGVEPDQIHVGCPENARASIRSTARQYSSQIRVTLIENSTQNTPFESYSSFGSQQFNSISWMKILFIRQLLRDFEHVIYSDIDVIWLRNPIPYLAQVAKTYPLAFQTEGQPRFPPAVCAGFVSLRRSSRTTTFIDGLIELRDNLSKDERIDDQGACQRLIELNSGWLQDIFMLPEALFPNGLGYRSMLDQPAGLPPMESDLSPFLFHANWTVGPQNKYRLLASTGNWLVDEIPNSSQIELSRDLVESTDGSSIAKLPPILTVIYPVFDVRSDVVECIRRWGDQQNVAADRYRVIVAAGAVNEAEKRELETALRPQDSLILLPGKGRDADYWNAGARAATTPWLLFVEAHAVPENGSVAAMTEWIVAHPEAVAVNFRIRSFQDHLMAGLMRRWFAQIHAIWALPSTWPRLHRAAFCIRQDAFRKAGPLEPQYGQFAPVLLSARMHEHRLAIATLPEATVKHEDSPQMLAHHDDTADYVRGELDARTDNEPAFFERYFGLSPHHGSTALLPARCARGMIAALFSASWRQPRRALANAAKAITLFPAALVGLRERSRILDFLTRADEYAVMQLPLGEKMRWWRFIVAHRRVIRAEQMRWIQRNSRPVSTSFLEEAKSVDILDPMTTIGLHGLEYSDGDPFRWTHPLFVLRLESPRTSGLLILETRNLSRQIQLSRISAAIASRAVSEEDISVDKAGNIGLRIRKSSKAGREVVVAIAMQEIVEPGADSGPGRRLGLPLFSIRFAPDQPVPE